MYLDRATAALRGNGDPPDDALLPFLSPLGWEHINLTGDYLWRQSARLSAGKVSAAAAGSWGLSVRFCPFSEAAPELRWTLVQAQMQGGASSALIAGSVVTR